MEMSRVVHVYEGDRLLGEVEVVCTSGGWGEAGVQLNGVVFRKEIRIDHYSTPSERCPPLAVLHTITSTSASGGRRVCFKLECKDKSPQNQNSPLSVLHSTCLRENKTAIMSFGEEELHLVAMHSRKRNGQFPCFWGFQVTSGLYDSCLTLLNLRCLGIVFDLDETLIVANTMRSFEDKIEGLQRKINSDPDPQRVSGMLAELKRYQDDKNILKQYVDNDEFVEDGKVIKAQSEVVLALSDNHQTIVRPLIRLQDKNIILTRINPQIRDTSVLVRLRPAWEDLRGYLTAKGRKRFEVYVCTMAERDYALEMWRLLDPDSNLISPTELLDRIVCVKSGLKKSLFSVFQDANCHPKMALVIDDRLKVWDEKDQPRVHVVPAFAPYYAPQAEANNTIPVLCVARNVACNVRGGFFKEFDECLLQRIAEIAYEDDIKEIPSPPDVSNYLVSEDDPSSSNGNRDPPGSNGNADSEVERRLKEGISATSALPFTISNLDPKIAPALQYAVPSSIQLLQSTIQSTVVSFPVQPIPQVASAVKTPIAHINPLEASLHGSPAREEGEVPEYELDPDTRRRLLILQHGQDSRERASSDLQFPVPAPMQVSAPLQVSAPRAEGRGWFPVEEELSPRQVKQVVPPKEFPGNSEPMQNPPHHPFRHKLDNSIPPDRAFVESQRMPKEAIQRDDRSRLNQPLPSFHSFSGDETSMAGSSSANRDVDIQSGRTDPSTDAPDVALQDIAFRCGTKVEFRQSLISSAELQFSVEVFFAGEKIGEAIGKTRREAQHHAAQGSLMNLCERYLLSLKQEPGSGPGDWNRSLHLMNNGFANDGNLLGHQSLAKEEVGTFSAASESPRLLDPRFEPAKKSTGPISALKELCAVEGLGLAFQTQPQLLAPGQKNEVYAQVEIDGQILGKGIGLTWDEAKSQAAEKALGTLKPMLGHFGQKRHGSPRSWQGPPSKRSKQEFSRVMPRLPPSARYTKHSSPVP